MGRLLRTSTTRRPLYVLAALALCVTLAGPACARTATEGEWELGPRPEPHTSVEARSTAGLVTLFMSGDVMTGRGIDQVLAHPSDPRLYEPYVKSAVDYVELAEEAHGAIEVPVDDAYIWGDALQELERLAPDVRLINLETSVTASDDHWEGKGIHYRMHPANIPCLTAAQIDCCALANNHVLDWGYAGLTETLDTLRGAGIQAAGAGQDLQAAEAPAVIDVAGKGRVLVFSYGLPTSGVPAAWAAAEDRPGVNWLADLSREAIGRVKERVDAVSRQGDIVVVSIHWGSNWGYEIPPEHVAFAHRLIDEGGVDVVHGHSSHHVMGIEVYHDRPVFYGCGDLLNDYEGIGGYEEFRSDLALLYVATIDPATGELAGLQMVPMQVRRLRLNRASSADARWLGEALNREGRRLGTRVALGQDGMLTLEWD